MGSQSAPCGSHFPCHSGNAGGQASHRSHWHAWLIIAMPSYIPLAKANISGSGKKLSPMVGEEGNEYLLNNNTNY
jgi:hypothetical protein